MADLERQLAERDAQRAALEGALQHKGEELAARDAQLSAASAQLAERDARLVTSADALKAAVEVRAATARPPCGYRVVIIFVNHLLCCVVLFSLGGHVPCEMTLVSTS